MKRQGSRNEVRVQSNITSNISPFIDAETISQLEPSLNRHYLGTPNQKLYKNNIKNNTKYNSTTKNSPNSNNNHSPNHNVYTSPTPLDRRQTQLQSHSQGSPPPLPQVSSSSDVYVKKIELFKKKLKNLKTISSSSSSSLTSATTSTIPKTSSNSNLTKKQTNDTLTLDNNKNTNNLYNPIHLTKSSFQTSYQANYDNKCNFEAFSPNIPAYIFNNTNTNTNTSINTTNNYNSNNNPNFNTHIANISKTEIPITKRSLAKQNKCSICSIDLDTFYNLQDGERILELKCGHMVHEECMVMEIDMNITMANAILPDRSKIVEYLPTCLLCSNSTTKAYPKDNSMLTDLYNRILTSHIENPQNSFNTISTSNVSMNSPITPTFSDSSRFLDTENSSATEYATNHMNPMDVWKNNTGTTGSNYNSSNGGTPDSKHSLPITGGFNRFDHIRNRSVDITELRKFSERSSKMASYKKHSKMPSRGSVASGTSAIVSSVSDPNINGGLSSWCSEFTEDLLQKKFMEELMNLSLQGIVKDTMDQDILLNPDLLNSLGTLRMVDKIDLIDANKNGIESIPIESYCYLFQHTLLVLRSTDFKFNLISINLSNYIDSSDPGILILKNSKTSKDYHKFIFNSKKLENKWNAALNNFKLRFDPSCFTSTLKVDEFDHLLDNNINAIDEVETLGTLQSYIGDDGYRRLPTGVCPRFYEGTINSLIFQSKPTNAIIVINQNKPLPTSVVAIKNIIRSLSMIGIDILLVLCSTSSLSMNTDIADSFKLEKKDFRKLGEAFLSKIDKYQDYLMKKTKKVNNGLNLYNLIDEYIQTTPARGEIVNIVLSNTSLAQFKDVPTTNNVMIEIGLDSNKKSNRVDVSDIAEWSDIMEVICVRCGLEFDESDFYISSDDESDDDTDSDNDETDTDSDNDDDKTGNRSNKRNDSLDDLCANIERELGILD